MIELKRKLDNTNITITKLDKRIKDLEILTTKVNERLNDESLKRMELQNVQLTSSEGNNFQIKTLKESIEKLATLLNNSFIEFKESITKEFKDKTSNLQTIIEEKTNLIDEVLKSNSEFENNQKNLYEEIKTKVLKTENEVNSSLKVYKEEINEKSNKIKNFEKVINDDHIFLEEQINSINKQFSLIDKESNINKTFKTKINKTLADIESNLRIQKENLSKLKINYNTNLTNYDEKINNVYVMLRNEADNVRGVQDDIYTHLELFDNKAMTKLRELSDYFNKEIKMQQSEIEHFEKHILDEHSRFSTFYQEKMEKLEENVNKNVSYNDVDIKQIKIIINNIKNEYDDLKQKINDDINELNKFHNKKNDTLLKVLMSNNLIPPDFDYNSFCAWKGNTFIINNINSSNRNNNFNINNNSNEENSS
jgi:chromosome segregation ATPase